MGLSAAGYNLMAKLRLTSSGIVDIDFTGSRLTSGGLVQGSPTGGGTTVAVPDIVGDTAAVADGKITGAGLVVGTVTGDIDPVIAQNPAAGTQVALGSAVDYTLTTGSGAQYLFMGSLPVNDVRVGGNTCKIMLNDVQVWP